MSAAATRPPITRPITSPTKSLLNMYPQGDHTTFFRQRDTSSCFSQGVPDARSQPRAPLVLSIDGERQRHGSGVTHEDDQPLAPRDGGVEKVSRKHDEMARQKGNDDARVLAPLR